MQIYMINGFSPQLNLILYKQIDVACKQFLPLCLNQAAHLQQTPYTFILL